MSDIRLWGALALWALGACTQAPAPCGDDKNCPNAQCINGACVVVVPAADAGHFSDGDIVPDGGSLDRGLDRGGLDRGGLDRGGLDRGPLDALPPIDAQPGCEFLTLDVEVVTDDLVVRRNEPVDLRITAADGAILSYSSSAGGAFLDQPTGVRWIARDEVDWPWRTGGITLTVSADLGDCRAQRRVQITLLGDVLLADTTTGQLQAIGSDGRWFGQWRLIDQSGVSALARTADGGFVAAIRGEFDGVDYAPEILRLNANGEEMFRFAKVDDGGETLFTGPIRQLYVVGDTVIVANVADDTIRWFDGDGRLTASAAGGGSWIECMAPRNGTAVFSVNRERRVFEVTDGEVNLVANAAREVYGLFPLLDGSTLMTLTAYQSELERLTTGGQILPVPAMPQGYSVIGLTPFDDGYLALSDNNWVIEFDADLNIVENFQFSNYMARSPRAIVWLHTP